MSLSTSITYTDAYSELDPTELLKYPALSAGEDNDAALAAEPAVKANKPVPKD